MEESAAVKGSYVSLEMDEKKEEEETESTKENSQTEGDDGPEDDFDEVFWMKVY